MSAFGTRLALGLLRLLARLPLPALRALGGCVGLAAGWMPGRRFETCMANLRLCYPDRDHLWHQNTARKSLIHEACNLLEMPRLWRLPSKRLAALAVRESGLELLEQTRGKGVVFVTPHFGSWEYTGLYLAAKMPMVSMYRPLKQPAFDRFVRRGRQHTGGTLVPTDVGGVRQLLRALRQRQAVGVLPDHVPRHKEDGVMAPFFGVMANTGALAARLAQREDVVVVLAQARRCRGGFAVSLRPVDPRVYAPDPVQAATGVNATVEACIADDIAQYWWSYPRFRKRLTEPESLYS